MRVMEIVSGVGVNGAVMHALMLSRQMDLHGHEVTLVCRPGAWIGKQLEGTGVSVLESNMNRWPFTDLRAMKDVLKEKRIQVMHTHMTRAHNFGVFLCRITGVPSVATAHSHRLHPHWMLESHIIAVSEVTRRYHRRHHLIPADRIEHIPGFVDAHRFAAAIPDAAPALRSELGLPPDTPLLGAIGDFLPRKGQLYLVRAMPAILKAVPEARLILAGTVRKPEYYARIQQEAKHLNVDSHIIWAGYRSDVDRLLAALDVYVLPSLDEMFPVAVLEAMSAGCACVATAVGGTPECALNPDALSLVPPANPAALAEAVLALLQNPQMSALRRETARQTALQNFAVEQVAPAVEAALQRIAGICAV